MGYVGSSLVLLCKEVPFLHSHRPGEAGRLAQPWRSPSSLCTSVDVGVRGVGLLPLHHGLCLQRGPRVRPVSQGTSGPRGPSDCGFSSHCFP